MQKLTFLGCMTLGLVRFGVEYEDGYRMMPACGLFIKVPWDDKLLIGTVRGAHKPYMLVPHWPGLTREGSYPLLLTY